jgi:hypothetical protein
MVDVPPTPGANAARVAGWFAFFSYEFQIGTPGNILGLIPQVGPTPESFHFAAGYPEPGNELFWFEGSPAQWQSHFGLPIDLFEKAMEYVDFIAEFFTTDPDGKLLEVSYDLFNEPNAPSIAQSPRESHALFEFVAATYVTLTQRYAAPVVTLGIAGEADLQYYYFMLRRSYYIPFSYVSFNYYFRDDDPNVRNPAGVFDRARRVADQVCRCPIICSEFFGINGPLWVNRGKLKAFYIDHMLRNDMGGYLWGYLQSNSFAWERHGDPGAPIDGIKVPVDPRSSTGPIALRDDNYQDPQDRAAAKDWLAGR